MILIFSTQDDISTHKVCEWLLYCNCNFQLINELNPIVDINYYSSNNQSYINFTLENGVGVKDEDINIIWYRRGLYFFKFVFSTLKSEKKLESIYSNMKSEYEKMTEAFFHHFSDRMIGDPNIASPNKLIVLNEAVKAGLQIPNTKVISNDKHKFSMPHVNKNISEIISFKFEDSLLYNRTTRVDKYNKKKFFPSLFQCLIERQFELRIFYFAGSFFAMAIYDDEQSDKVDYRDITGSKHSTRILHTLPVEIIKKLKKLIENLKYTTCSIDMIVNTNNDYFFLELNPVGQFGIFNADCQTNVEKFIANKLKDYANK